MKMRKCLGLALALSIAVGSLGAPTMAAEPQSHREPLPEIQRVSGSFNVIISAGKYKKVSSSFSLEAGETVTFNATYSPRSASVDFGLLDSSNVFHYFNVTTGSVDDGITVTARGQYTPAIRNNSTNPIDVSGFVECG